MIYLLLVINNNINSLFQNELVKLIGTTRKSLVGLKLTQLPADLTHLQYWVLANSSIQHLFIQNSAIKVRTREIDRGMDIIIDIMIDRKVDRK